MGFNKDKIHELYPGAEDLMFEAGKIWKLPDGKEHMLSEVCGSGEYFLEEKVDGACYQFVKTEMGSYLFGRTISKTTGLLTEKGQNVPHLLSALDCLPNRTILICEIYVPNGTSKDVTHIMGCLSAEAIKRQEKEGNIHCYVHDIIYYDNVNLMNTGAEDRYKILEAIWKEHGLDRYDFLRLAVKVDEDLEGEISRILKRGGEGVVMKKRDSVYVPGKRPAWDTIKVKQMDSVDLICIGLCPPTRDYTGKELGTWPYWAKEETDNLQQISLNGKPEGETGWIPVTKYYAYGCPSAIKIGAYDENGQLKELGTVSSGLTDEDKFNMKDNLEDYVMRVVSLDCMSLDKREQTLRHPVFKGWRDDKNPKDCLIKEVFA